MGKEVKIMRYEKPEIGLNASAVETIKGQNKDDLPVVDSQRSTISAYEADE